MGIFILPILYIISELNAIPHKFMVYRLLLQQVICLHVFHPNKTIQVNFC